MGKNLKPQFPFRTDREIIDKLDIIADYYSRDRNKQIEFLIKQCIKDFEQQHGEIQIKSEPK